MRGFTLVSTIAVLAQGLAMINVAGCLYKLGRIDECDVALDKAYHLIRDCHDDNAWNKGFGLRFSSSLYGNCINLAV